MNKTVTKIITAIFISLLIISISVSCLALTPSEIKGNSDVAGTNEITDLGKSLVGILQTVGIVLSVIVILVIGIKYMMGSAEEKAEYKKTMIPYIIGAILVFAASSIASIVMSISKNFDAGK